MSRHRHAGKGQSGTWTTIVALATTFAPIGASAQNPSNGPLTFEEGSPLQRLTYTSPMEAATTTARGDLSVDVWLGLSNIFEQDSSATHVLFLDLERLSSSVTVRWGATDRLELGGRVLLETTGAGTLDGVIGSWHDKWGFGQANRDRFPENEYDQRLTDGASTVYIDIPRRSLGLEDARLFAKVRALASADGSDVLSVKAEARVPGDANLAASERIDVALTALARHGMGSWHLHGLLGLSTVRASPELEPVLRGSTAFMTLAVERSFGSVSGVVQYQAQSAALRTFEHRELDRAPTNLVLGLAGRIGERWRWDASFQEDLPADTPAIDFTVGLRISRTW